ncbi:hypothetical protein IFM89_015659 [Coptis chinensis]|uniref:GDPGP1-like N-terminal domain-containing protein n=1 Tax=Coptis chinensis TaxID=261450 RepID=A0A835IC73_9MAGN|nr:hypothetical protein IFM89_015659 [Coptis chinensis]
MEEEKKSDVGTDLQMQLIYRCKKCLRIVASQENVVDHKRGEGRDVFKWKKRSDSWDTEKEPPKAAVEEGTVEEKFQCLGCKARLGSFNWAGAKLPLYTFKRMKNRMNEKESVGEMKESPVAFLDSLLLGEWEDRVQRRLFRYDVTACETKVISGNMVSLLGLNKGHHFKKRPLPKFRVDKVLQPFDENKFNFTKVGQEEVLFQFEESDTDETKFFPSAPIDTEDSPNVVSINVSPIEYGHVLLIPKILERFPQRIDCQSFLLALNMAAEAGNPYF